MHLPAERERPGKGFSSFVHHNTVLYFLFSDAFKPDELLVSRFHQIHCCATPSDDIATTAVSLSGVTHPLQVRVLLSFFKLFDLGRQHDIAGSIVDTLLLDVPPPAACHYGLDGRARSQCGGGYLLAMRALVQQRASFSRSTSLEMLITLCKLPTFNPHMTGARAPCSAQLPRQVPSLCTERVLTARLSATPVPFLLYNC